MARFNAWANERLYACVAQLPDEAYRADRKAFFGSIHHILIRLLVVDRLWTGRIEGKDVVLIAPLDYNEDYNLAR